MRSKRETLKLYRTAIFGLFFYPKMIKLTEGRGCPSQTFRRLKRFENCKNDNKPSEDRQTERTEPYHLSQAV